MQILYLLENNPILNRIFQSCRLIRKRNARRRRRRRKKQDEQQSDYFHYIVSDKWYRKMS